MSRGSISSWQDYGRRNSQIMPQFSGGPVEFMTCDEMEYKRGDGWFLSYTKIAGIVVVFIIGVVAAGFLGWYINSLPKKKPYETLDLLTDEIGDTDDVSTVSISPFVHPLKYRLELTPIINGNRPTGVIKGRVVIDFRVNGTKGLNKFSLSARNITVESYKLSSVETKERARQEKNAKDHVNYGEQLVETMHVLENDISLAVTKNETVFYERTNERSSKQTFSDGAGGSQALAANDSLHARSEKVQGSSTDPGEFLSATFQVASSNIPITEYEVDDDKEVHTVHLGHRIQQGLYLLEIVFETLIDDNAYFVANYTSSGEEKWLMGTKLKRSGARCLFPVFDDVLHKSVFSASVARPKETRVLSNMPLRTLRDASNNAMLVDTFDDSPPLAPHHLAFLMGHIDSIGSRLVGDTVVSTFGYEPNRRPNEIYLLDKLDPIIIHMVDVFSLPYSLPKLDIVGLPPGIDESMGSPGLIGLKRSLFRVTNESALVTKTNALSELVILMGQQWLDEFMNAKRSDEWIFEGSLIYFQHDIVRKIDPSSNASDSFILNVQLRVMDIDGYSISRPLHENVNYRLLQTLNDDHAKGACLIRMLHGAIGDTAFRNGYRKLITRWKYNATDVTDFMSIMEEEANSFGLAFEFPLDEAMNSWVSQGGYPLVTVIRNYEDASAILYQEQFALDRPLESISKFWHIPLNFADKYRKWSSPIKMWFPAEPKLALDNIAANDSWVLFNVNKTGYYRVHYDERNWMLLKVALEENHEQFPAETRASLIDDVFSMAAMGLMRYEFAFNFIKYMQMGERHYLPWSIFARHMFNLNRLLYETAIFNDFHEFVVKLVSPVYSEVGASLGEGSQLTMIAIKLACVFEHAECLAWAKTVFENRRTDDEIEEIIPSYIRETFYCAIARYGTRKEWTYFTERVLLTEDEEERKRLLSSLACFQAPWILQSVLNEILHEGQYQEDEVSVILKAFPRNPAAAQAASRFVRANWQEIAQRFQGSYKVLKSFVLSMVNGLTTEQDLEDLQMFRENNYDSMRGTRYAAALVEANGNFVTTWLKRSLPQLESILKEETEKSSQFLNVAEKS